MVEVILLNNWHEKNLRNSATNKVHFFQPRCPHMSQIVEKFDKNNH